MFLQIRTFVVNITVLLFFIHGLCYFTSPEDLYNTGSSLKKIKYVLLFLFIAFQIDKIKKPNLILVPIIFFLTFTFYQVANQVTLEYYLFILPASILVIDFKKINYIHWYRIACCVFILSTITAIAEFFILERLFLRFMGGTLNEYRVISIFVNPNNFGIMAVILTFFLVSYHRIKGYITSIAFKIIVLSLGLCQVVLSGSKTAIIVFGLFLILYIGYYCSRKKQVEKTLLFFVKWIPVISISLIVFLQLNFGKFLSFFEKEDQSIRSFSMASMDARNEQRDIFVQIIQADIEYLFFPSLHKSLVYMDNVYLFIWGYYGIIVFLLFLSLFLFVLLVNWQIKNYRLFILLLLFAIIGTTTNFIYLWPQGYIFWGITGYTLGKVKIKDRFEEVPVHFGV